MADVPLVVWLRPDRPVESAGASLGGKAGSLARLVAAGQPVPRSAVLTTAAYAAVAAAPAIRSLIACFPTANEPTSNVDPSDIDPSADVLSGDVPSDDAIDRAFLDVALPDVVARALDELARGWSGPVAVRSSATSEDLASSAFAGQYRSLLDVDPAELERAVRRVWASAWHAAPRTYRRLRAVAQDELAMAVLVMEMVEAEWAGVLFTHDPVGDDANVRVETVAGPGEALVSGAVTPDARTWPRTEAVLRATRVAPWLGELVARGLAIESTWGTPLDIEFAVDRSGRLWIVQARPITAGTATRHGEGTGGSPEASTLTRAGIAEMLPGVLPPLLRSTAGRHVDEGFRNLLARLGADLSTASDDGAAFVRFERSRAMLDLTLLRHTAETVPGGSAGAIDRGYGVDSPTDGVAAVHTSAAQVARVLRRRRSAVVESEIVVQAVDRLVEADVATLPGATAVDDTAELLARWDRVQDLGERATTAEMEVAALAAAAYEGVERTLSRHVGRERAREVAPQLTARPRRSAGPLDRCVRANGIDPSQQLSDARWTTMLSRSGSRSVFGGPTWADDPDLAWLAFRADDRPRDAAPDDPLRSIRPPAGDRRPPLSRLRRRFVRREAADAAELLDRRERTKRALLDLGGIAHRLTCAVAGRLVDSGVLVFPDDVWLLTPDELHTACQRGTSPDDLDTRRAALAADATVGATTTPVVGGDTGWPASPGSASGRAVVVETPHAGAIAHGDVLVARTTDAGWGPLFAVATAIVVEDGGPLSHAAILARELGVPAVVNLPGIVDRVRAAGPAAMLRVDGTTGAVELVASSTELPTLAPVVSPPEDEPRLGVFVTGLIGASALFGVVVSITEAVSSARGIRRTRSRAAVPATITAAVVRTGTDAISSATVGLAPAERYGRWAAALAIAGLLLGGATIVEYGTSGSTSRILWLITGVSTVLGAGAGAGVLTNARTRWPDVPPVVRRLTPGPRAHTSLRQCWHEMPDLHRRSLLVFVTIALALLTANILAPTALRTVDEPLYDALGAPDPDPWGPDWFGMYFGRPQVVVPAALIVALFTVRCRILAVAYPLTIMFGGLLNLGLGSLVGKDRPPLGAHADQTDSFPSGHAIEVTLLLGLVPLAIAVLTRSRWAGRVARVVASGVLVVMLIDGLREGSHWPTDHVGGFAIAMTAVVLVHAMARVPSLHRSCTRCPALALHREADRERPGGP